MSKRDADFADYVAARSTWLQRTAFMMCGNRAQAEDLVQTALVKLYVAWPRIQRRDTVDAYARRTLARVWIDELRRPWRRETTTDIADFRPDPADGPGQVGDRIELLQALRRLPDKQRIAVVLRHWQDLSVADTADVMGCTASAVKTHTARGVAALRTSLGSASSDPILNGDQR
ncbi:MAG: SigE family RNA polymerase sigma factor [Nocardioides sp.]